MLVILFVLYIGIGTKPWNRTGLRATSFKTSVLIGSTLNSSALGTGAVAVVNNC